MITTTVYVIDTSVLLADPLAVTRFAEHEVVLPLVVLTELEGKRHHPELGWAARQCLRFLEDLRTRHGSLIEPMPVNDEGGTLRVELNHQELDALPQPLTSDANDHRILAVACSLGREGREVVVVTKDLPLRLKAGVVGLEADEYRNELATDSGWTGFVELDAWGAVIDELYEHKVVDFADARELPCHAGVALHSGSQSALARVHPDKHLHLVRSDQTMFDLRGRSAEQHIAIDVLLDEQVGIVSLGGSAGTGKSVLALAAGLEAVLERRTHQRVVVFRPIYAVGGQDLGYLPGSETEKMSPWGAAVTDALESMVGREVIDEVIDRGLLEVLPLTHIRGRSLTDSFVVIDEAQNLERSVLLTALSRLGRGSRVVLTHDVAQRDNLRVGRHDGIVQRHRDAQGPPAVRARHPDALGAVSHRRPGHPGARRLTAPIGRALQGTRGSAGLAGPARERDLGRARRAVTRVGDGDLVAARVLLHGRAQRQRRRDLGVVDGRDHVALLQAGLGRRTVARDVGDLDARRRLPARRRRGSRRRSRSDRCRSHSPLSLPLPPVPVAVRQLAAGELAAVGQLAVAVAVQVPGSALAFCVCRVRRRVADRVPDPAEHERGDDRRRDDAHPLGDEDARRAIFGHGRVAGAAATGRPPRVRPGRRASPGSRRGPVPRVRHRRRLTGRLHRIVVGEGCGLRGRCLVGDGR